MAKGLKEPKGQSEAVLQRKDKPHNDQRFENTKEVIRSRASKEGQTTQ